MSDFERKTPEKAKAKAKRGCEMKVTAKGGKRCVQSKSGVVAPECRRGKKGRCAVRKTERRTGASSRSAREGSTCRTYRKDRDLCLADAADDCRFGAKRGCYSAPKHTTTNCSGDRMRAKRHYRAEKYVTKAMKRDGWRKSRSAKHEGEYVKTLCSKMRPEAVPGKLSAWADACRAARQEGEPFVPKKGTAHYDRVLAALGGAGGAASTTAARKTGGKGKGKGKGKKKSTGVVKGKRLTGAARVARLLA